MKVIVFGHNGWIGTMMCALLEKEKGIDIIRPTDNSEGRFIS